MIPEHPIHLTSSGNYSDSFTLFLSGFASELINSLAN